MKPATLISWAGGSTAVVVAAATVAWWVEGHESGSLSGWIEAVATLAAVAAATTAAAFTAQTLRIERARDLDREEEKKAAQAELVSAWREGDTIAFRNASPTPIYRVRMWLHPRGQDPIYCKWRGLVAPTRAGESHEVIAMQAEAVEALHAWRRARKANGETLPVVLVEVTFRDSAGIWWRRMAHGGALHRIGPRDARESRG